MVAYGYYAGHSTRSYEEDHLISLELAGCADRPSEPMARGARPSHRQLPEGHPEDPAAARRCAPAR